jgi:hypothetical protein
MKNILLIILSIVAINAYGQAPEGVNYQAVVRDNLGAVIVSSPIGMEFSVYEVSTATSPVYVETFSPTTNAFGLVNLVLGEGVVVSGNFSAISWTNGPYILQIAADVTGGTSYTVLGDQKLTSVPFALYAKSADYNNLLNLPTIPVSTSDLVNDSGFITSPNDADADPTNEYNTGISLVGTSLTVTDAGGPQTIDLSPLQDGVNDADADPTNEYNSSVTLSGTTLSVTDAGGPKTVNLSSLVNDADFNPTNELQALSIVGDQITLSNGGGTVQTQRPVLENTGSRSNICSGNTAPGVGWTTYTPTAIRINVVTSGCAFGTTPRYFTSIGGTDSHYTLVGSTAIYVPTTTGFTVYVRYNNDAPLLPAAASAGGWYINWVAVGQ